MIPQATGSAPQTIRLDANMPVAEQPYFPIVSSSSHPGLALFFIAIKILNVALFLLLPFFMQALTVAEIVIILGAVDFWVIKNLAGRLLVGLRWWVDFDEQGQQKWKFECKVNEKDVNPANDKIFWWTLALFCLIWTLLTVINILRIDLQNVTVCLFNLGVLGFNLYSFYKCSKVQSENVKKLAMQYGVSMAQQFLAGSIVANFV